MLLEQSPVGGASRRTEGAGDLADEVQQAHLDEARRLRDRDEVGGPVHDLFGKAEWSGVHDPAHSAEGPGEPHQEGGTLVGETGWSDE